MKKTQPLTMEKFLRIKDMLSPLDFEPEHELTFVHKHTGTRLDCSALNEDYILQQAAITLFDAGIKEGKRSLKKKCRELFQDDD